jgi:hypothetical protein
MLALASSPTWAAGGHKRHRSAAAAPPGSQYVFALAAANKFLHAWQTDDLETGMVLLSDRIRHSQDPEKFEHFFSGSNDRAFEIGRAQSTRGRYRFTVVLMTIAGEKSHRRFSDMVVINSGKDDWVVDKLP